ncbi:MAG: PAS domain S-box protein, partial [Woeseia sp.]
DRETRRLRESEEKFRTTFETAALGMLHVDPAGRFTRANPSVCKIIGYSEAELIGMNPDILAHPDDLAIGQVERQRMFRGEIPSYSVEKRYIHKNGSTVWMNVTISTVRDKNGQVEYAVALLEDISWRKRAESELHRQQEINRLLLENLTEGVVACDADGRLMLFNKAAREWHGADPREIPSEQWSDYYDLYDADGETPLDVNNIPLMRAFRGERVKGVEMSIVRKGHPARIVLASGAPLLDADGTKRGAVVVMHDVTLRRQSLQKLERSAEKLRAANAAVENERASLARRVAERTLELTAANAQLATAKEAAESASKAKSAFLAVMSHEIRTPMNGILGMVDVLSQSLLAEDQKDAVLTIRESSFSLLRLIDDILDFSKVEAGRLELENTVVGLPELVEGVYDALTPDALANDVDIKLFIDPQVPSRVVSDPTRLRQLLFNLIGNAVKFSGGREAIRGCVQVRVESQTGEPLTVAFRIIDNGVGIAPDALPRLFDSFTQAEVSTTRRFGGTGLGLAITKRLIELMHGSIEVKSALGEGSEFIVRLPLQQSLERVENPEFDLRGVSCVLVDSQNSDSAALAVYLDDAHVTNTLVADPGAAAQLAAQGQGTTVVVQHFGKATPPDAELLASCRAADKQVNLLITRGPRSHARILAPHVVVLQAGVVRRRDFLRAVAIAAGRASPEVSLKQDIDLVRGQLVAPTVAQARTDGRLILVAEDDAINQKVILRQLALLGYAGEMASNGDEALRMWRAGSYALLLTDLHMPEMDGYELAKSIRSKESPQQRIPIIALTANALRGEAERAAKAGFDAYLTKPLQLSVLGATLDDWIPEVRSEKQVSYMQAAGAASESSPAIDASVLRSVIGNDQHILREFLAEYLTASENQVDELRSTVAKGDVRRIAEHAHSQKGAARAVGASRLGDLCAELENAARAEDRRDIQEIVARLEVEALKVNAEIYRLLDVPGTHGPAGMTSFTSKKRSAK